MRTHYPSAFFVSVLLHGTVAGLLVFFTYYFTQQEDKPPVIFELVAGPPTDPGALVAPALGNTLNPVKVDMPKEEPAPAQPAPPTPPVQETVQAVEPTPTPAAPAPTAKPTPTAKPKADVSIKQQMKRSERMSYRDYLKKHPLPKPAPQVASTATAGTGKGPRIDAQGIAEGVRGGSVSNTRGGGGGKALTREEQDQRSTYFSFLNQELQKAADETLRDFSDKLVTSVEFDVEKDGTISKLHIVRSSGNRDFDDAVLQTFRMIGAIGSTPTGEPYRDCQINFHRSVEQ